MRGKHHFIGLFIFLLIYSLGKKTLQLKVKVKIKPRNLCYNSEKYFTGMEFGYKNCTSRSSSIKKFLVSGFSNVLKASSFLATPPSTPSSSSVMPATSSSTLSMEKSMAFSSATSIPPQSISPIHKN